ncbi:MAG: TAXI family TRAP transporter solute-binding subunit [Synergistaceae bacterium]|nr:TAXI family TRAP transporter solute-binding subunit [Synergistaceae bacterium]
MTRGMVSVRCRLVALALSLILFAAAGAAAGEFVTIVTGSTGGTYYPVGTLLANRFNTAMLTKGYKFSAQSSGGTTENLEMLHSGQARMAIAMCNLTGLAYLGQDLYGDSPNPDLRYVFGLWPDVSQFVITKSSGIKGWGDLKGKKIAVGPPASGTEFSTRTMLQAISGLTFDDIVPEYLGYSEAAQALQNGHIDGALLEAGVPTSAVTELYAGRTEVDMLPYEGEDLKKLLEAAPWYAEVLIPAGTYPKQGRDLHVVGVKCALIAHPDVADDIIYQSLETIYASREALLKAHSAFNQVDFDRPLAGLYGAPLHPGAVKFYREKGMTVPEELLPPDMK